MTRWLVLALVIGCGEDPGPSQSKDEDNGDDGFDLGDDCDDTLASVHPNALETPYDGIDQDCADGDLVDLDQDGFDALRKGADNLAAHVNIVKTYGLPCVVAINGFPTDTPAETALVRELALKAGAETVVVHTGFSDGGAGSVDLANAVVTACEKPTPKI